MTVVKFIQKGILCIITATPAPLCTSMNILFNASCDFDDGPCGFDVPMYPHLWELTRNDYGEDTGEVIKGHHTTGKDFCYMFSSEASVNLNVIVKS